MAKIKEKHNERDSEVEGRHRWTYEHRDNYCSWKDTFIMEQMLWSMITYITFFAMKSP